MIYSMTNVTRWDDKLVWDGLGPGGFGSVAGASVDLDVRLGTQKLKQWDTITKSNNNPSITKKHAGSRAKLPGYTQYRQ